MPIRAINDPHYKGVSELYRKSDGEVTGYYVTYRDADGKPIKRRVEASSRDEALLQLVSIKKEIDLKKKGKTMGKALPKIVNESSIHEAKVTKPSLVLSKVNNQNYRQVISNHHGMAVVSLIDIVAFEDINILYGYEKSMQIVENTKHIIDKRLKTLQEDRLFLHYEIENFSYELFHVHEDKLCLFIKNSLSHRMVDFIVNALMTAISEQKFEISAENYLQVNATFGTTKAESSMSLIYAEKALQEAKKSQNPYIYHDSYSMGNNEHIVNKVYETLVYNINEMKIIPYFQGIFDVNDSTTPYKYETLMRLTDKEGHVLSPAVFIEKSKEYRLYTELMSQMIDKVFEIMDTQEIAVTLNLSYLDIYNKTLGKRLIDKVQTMNVGRLLTVEIVESEKIQDIELVKEFIFTLKKKGVLIAIDDFGSGFSNFDMVADLDVDYVKLDGSLVSKIHDVKYRTILESMVKIFHDLNIKVIAEYISNANIMELSQNIGVDYLQGYHLHKPQKWESVMQTFGYKGAADDA